MLGFTSPHRRCADCRRRRGPPPSIPGWSSRLPGDLGPAPARRSGRVPRRPRRSGQRSRCHIPPGAPRSSASARARRALARGFGMILNDNDATIVDRPRRSRERDGLVAAWTLRERARLFPRPPGRGSGGAQRRRRPQLGPGGSAVRGERGRRRADPVPAVAGGDPRRRRGRSAAEQRAVELAPLLGLRVLPTTPRGPRRVRVHRRPRQERPPRESGARAVGPSGGSDLLLERVDWSRIPVEGDGFQVRARCVS